MILTVATTVALSIKTFDIGKLILSIVTFKLMFDTVTE